MFALSAPAEFRGKPTTGIDMVPAFVWVLAIVSMAGVSIALRYTSLNHHDNAWLLYAAGEYLNGAQLYVDLVEVNPPLIFFLYCPPVWVANMLLVEPTAVFYAYIFTLATVSCGLSYMLLNKTGRTNRLIVILLLVFALFVLPRGDFGQREHLMVIFTMPYIFLIARRVDGFSNNRAFAFSLGLLAVLGVGLKPHFLLIPAAMELYILIRSRDVKQNFRPETLALGFGLLAYIGVIFHVAPEYITKTVPMALEVYNQAFKSPYLHVIVRLELLLIIFLGVTGGLMLREGRLVPAPVMVLFLAGCAAYSIYVIQMKGWSYHSYPALAFMTIASGLFVAEWSRQNNTEPIRFSTLCIVSIVILGLTLSALVDYRYVNVRVDAWRKIVAQNRPLTAFYTMSSTLSAGFPLVTVEGLKWSSRFPTLWLLPGIIRSRQIAEGKPLPRIDEIERYHTNAVVEDMTKFKPELVIVEVGVDKLYFGKIAFDYIEYFSQDERFRTLWSKYQKIGHSELGFDYYRLKE